MTQWLFKKDVCACKDTKETVAPIKIALPNLPRASPKASKNSSTLLLIFGTIVSVALISCLISVLDIQNVFSFKMPHSNGSERILVCGRDLTHNQREMKFDNLAPASISQGEYPYITLRDSFIADGELKQLAHISSLRGITLKNCMGFSTYGMRFLASSLDLKYLSLAQCQVSQSDLNVLQYSNLDTLDLSETPIADLDWTNLLKNPNLRKIILRKVYITDKNKNLFEIAGFRSGGEDTFVR